MPLRKLSAILLSQLVAASVHRPSSRKLDYCVVYDENVFVHTVVEKRDYFLAGIPSSGDVVEVLHLRHTMVKNIRYHLNACLYLSSACSFFHFILRFIIIFHL